MSGSAKTLVGIGKLIDPGNLVHIFVSPRTRARETFKLLFGNLPPGNNVDDGAAVGDSDEFGSYIVPSEKVTITEDIAEWDYGAYEGMLVGDIRKGRKERGLDQDGEFYIWRDGCEEGE